MTPVDDGGGDRQLQICKKLQTGVIDRECLFRNGVPSVDPPHGILRERCMSKFAIRLLTLAMYATAPVVVPMVTPANAETSSSRHLKKHQKKIQKRHRFSDPWSAGQAWPVTRPSSQPGEVCPGIARSFECKTWPPPMYDDPDRKVSGADGG